MRRLPLWPFAATGSGEWRGRILRQRVFQTMITTNPFLGDPYFAAADEDKLHEECGVFGVVGGRDAAAIVALEKAGRRRALFAALLLLTLRTLTADAGIRQLNPLAAKHIAQPRQRLIERIAYRRMRAAENHTGLIVLRRHTHLQRPQIRRI